MSGWLLSGSEKNRYSPGLNLVLLESWKLPGYVQLRYGQQGKLSNSNNAPMIRVHKFTRNSAS